MRRSWGLTFVCLVLACGGDDDDTVVTDGGEDAAPDAGPSECVVDEDCDDGIFCNGAESCLEGQCVRGARIVCDDGIECTIDACDEALRRCVSVAPDADGDGVRDASCLDAEGNPLGADCDDDDPNRFPGNPEVCDLDGHDEDCDPTTFGAVDYDRDGYFDARCCNTDDDGTRYCGTDCNDVRPNVNPAATEACDRVDNDCDGLIDEGVLVAGWVDADRDGYGDHSRPMESCPGLAGFVPAGDAEDCDDDDRTRNPGQVEICDGIDNDCDDIVDENPQSVRWYRDLDGDGFGHVAGGTVVSCAPVAGYSLFGTDCNDAVAGINPAAPELCNGIDDDCVGGADFMIAPGDFEDDDEDGIADIACGAPRGLDCDDLDPATGVGNIEICDGRDNDCDGRIDEDANDRLWFYDGDGDGHGSSASVDFPVVQGCRPPPGYVASGADCDDTDPTRFPGAPELCDGFDDDCDGAVDEGGVCGCAPGLGDCDPVDGVCETSTFTSLQHCGACGNPCVPGPQVRATVCAGGACVITSCRAGFDDCDGDFANGCEVDLRVDTTSCGACGNVCAPPPGTQVASARCGPLGCRVDTCVAGFDDCDGDFANGCEVDTQSDPLQCGACGVRCGPGSLCVGGACVCGGGSVFCPGAGCVFTSGDPRHCGACGVDCGADACIGGVCERRCTPGSADCDGDPLTVCETDVTSSPDHCGACGNACPAPSDPLLHLVDSDCVESRCRFLCAPGYADCDGVSVNGCEAELSNDPTSCGACGRRCGVGGSCALGVCDGVAKVGVGSEFSCALRTNGEVLCWGANSFGQLGVVGVGASHRPLPVLLPGFAEDLAVGDSHACAIVEAAGFSEVHCWGNDGNGQLGDGTAGGSSAMPAPVLLPADFVPVELALGQLHSCARGVSMTGAEVWCWGRGGFGELGNGTTTAAQPTPVRVEEMAGVPTRLRRLVAGGNSNCGLPEIVSSAPEMVCWGANASGQLGLPGGGNRTRPVTVSISADFVEPGTPIPLTMGDRHGCALVLGNLYCFGNNATSQIGGGAGSYTSPTLVARPAGDLRAVHAGRDTTCLRYADGRVFCRGANESGALVLGAPAPVTTWERLFTLGNGVEALFLGSRAEHQCVRSFGGQVFCWGTNVAGRLGLGFPSAVEPPSLVADLTP